MSAAISDIWDASSYLRSRPHPADTKMTHTGLMFVNASTAKPAPTTTTYAAVGVASGANRRPVASISEHDTSTIPRHAPRSAADWPRNTTLAIGIASSAGVDHPFTCRTEHPISIDDSTG
jgi:hypothetical protein